MNIDLSNFMHRNLNVHVEVTNQESRDGSDQTNHHYPIAGATPFVLESS